MSIPSADNGLIRRDETLPSGRLHLAALALVTLGLLYLCYRLLSPLLPALVWAFALAVIADPMYRRLARGLKNENVAAFVSVVLVVTFLLVPTLLVTAQLGVEVREATARVREELAGGRWRDVVQQVPYVGDALPWIEQNVDLEPQVRQAIAATTQDIGGLLGGSLWAGLQMFMAMLMLFFFLRDRDGLLQGVRSLSPLTPQEQDQVSSRVEDAIYATVYGTFVSSLVMAVSGGLLFWLLGLPGAVLWGVVMFVLGVLPLVGAGFVWVPAAGYLLVEGRFGAALILVAWGAAMAGPIGNYIYGHYAGGRMHLHPVPTLIAYAGGLAVFGLTGMVLGPITLALAVAMIDVWKWRTTPAVAQGPARPEEAVVAG